MRRPPTLDQQIADARLTLQQRRRLRARIKGGLRAAEIADRRIRLAEAVLATLEGARPEPRP